MPSLAEFDYAMLRPGRHVPAIRRLGGGTVIARGEGQPFRITGNEAVVYKLDNPGFGGIALRCFLDEEVAERAAGIYSALAEPATMRRLAAEPSSPLVQRLAWFSDGVTLRSNQLRSFSTPVVATEWIDGPTLFRAAEHAARSRNGQALFSLAEGWRRAVGALSALQFAHGSLSPDNALVDMNRGIVLVDYDHAWWPGLPLAAESPGLTHYRHRHGQSATPWQSDAFAALVIYVSLRVLASNPALRDRYGQPSVVRDGSLLFDQHDFDAPKRSELFRELELIDDVEVRALVAVLRQAAQHDPEQTPIIDRAIAAAINAKQEVIRRNQPQRQTRSSEPEQPALDDSVERDAPSGSASEPVTGVSPVMRAALDRAIASGDAVTVSRIWPALATDPESSWQAISANKLIQRFVNAGLEEAMEHGSSQAIIDAAAVSRSLGVPLSTEYVRAERRARLALNLRAQVNTAVAADDRETLADLGAIEDVFSLSEHDTDVRATVSLASQLRTLRQAVELGDDEQILRSVTPELLATPRYLPSDVDARVQLARARMRWKEEVRRVMKSRDGERLVALFDVAPAGAPDKLTPTERKRAQRLIDQTAALEKLSLAMSSGSDRQLVDAMNSVESTGALLPPELDWASVSSVIDRLSLVASARRAALTDPRDYLRLGRLLPALREAYGGETAYLGAGLDVERLEWEVQRDTHRRRLLEAIQTNDETAIAHAASPDPYNVVADLAPADQARVEALLARLQQANPLTTGGS